MGFYWIPSESRVTELDDALYASWVAAGNPKTSYYQPIGDPPGPGYTYDGSQWVAPPVYIPQQVTRFQGKAALLNAGLLDDVETAVASGDALLQLAWSDALTFERQSPMVAGITAALGLTDAQVNQLFIDAAQISA